MTTNASTTQPDFCRAKQAIIEFLDAKHTTVLATSLNDRVTARTVSFASDGLDILFLSWGHHTKCAQIRGNPRVALCRDNVQIEGRAEILGNPLDKANSTYAAVYREKLPRDFAGFAHQPGMVLVRVVPTAVVTFVKGGDGLHLEHLDLESETAYLEPMTG